MCLVCVLCVRVCTCVRVCQLTLVIASLIDASSFKNLPLGIERSDITILHAPGVLFQVQTQHILNIHSIDLRRAPSPAETTWHYSCLTPFVHTEGAGANS